MLLDGHDRIGSRPGRLGFQAAAPSAAGQPGHGMQYPVTQRLGLGFGQIAPPAMAGGITLLAAECVAPPLSRPGGQPGPLSTTRSATPAAAPSRQGR
jgi:hypothetical protein